MVKDIDAELTKGLHYGEACDRGGVAIMVIDKRYISEMRRNGFCISKAKDAEILAQFSTEPDDFHEWTEQDI